MSSPAHGGSCGDAGAGHRRRSGPGGPADIFRRLHSDGTEAWTLQVFPRPGSSTTAIPPAPPRLIHEGWSTCPGPGTAIDALDLATGKTGSKKHFRRDFGGPDKLAWGFCSSPIVADGRLIVHPGGPQASLVALNPADGDVLWKSPRASSGHSSLVFAAVGGGSELIGYDDISLGDGTSRRESGSGHSGPSTEEDFDVRRPIVRGDKLHRRDREQRDTDLRLRFWRGASMQDRSRSTSGSFPIATRRSSREPAG